MTATWLSFSFGFHSKAAQSGAYIAAGIFLIMQTLLFAMLTMTVGRTFQVAESDSGQVTTEEYPSNVFGYQTGP
ncbi:hypothetical protein AB6A40_009577 [Gnathostoma spinigerum]|uniref:Uncharacterized protein n=1 Tax=Gnathostoma spinigerum TaxID=75299 RepID=A0ABD6ESD6_9BILA